MTSNKKYDPFKNLVLDEYEQELEDAIERGEYVHDDESEENIKMLQEAAKNFVELSKSKSVTLRVRNKDLISIKAKAKKSNLPYQKLINLLISNYAEGKFKIAI